MSFGEFQVDVKNETVIWLELPAHRPFDHHGFLAAMRRYESMHGRFQSKQPKLKIGVLAHYAPTDEGMMQLFLTSGWFVSRFSAMALVASGAAAHDQLQRFLDENSFRTPIELMLDQDEAIGYLHSDSLTRPGGSGDAAANQIAAH